MSQPSGSLQLSSPCLPSSSDPQIVGPKDDLNRAPESQPPPDRDLPEVDIVIKHPGYQEGQNVLMLFRDFDRVGKREGLHHGTVLTACQIVSGRHHGFFTQEKGGAPIQLGFDDVLLGGKYYYTVPDDDCYAIFPSFEHWPFPHDSLPSTWTKLRKPRASRLTPMPARSYTAQAILDRDPTCLLSGMGDIRERAYICPKEELRWFQANAMNNYNLNRLLIAEASVDDMSNATAMRSDIHKAYDKRFFVIVPKLDRWTAHFMEPTFHLGSLYHNMLVNLHTDVALEYMFSRFAWTIFPLIRVFLEQGPPRRVRTQMTNAIGLQDMDMNLDGEAISKTFFSRPRNASPKKRRTGDSSGLSPEDHSLAGSDQSQNTGTPTSPSAAELDNASTSCLEPISPVTVPVDHRQTKKDGYSKTCITDKDPRIQQLYAHEDVYERLRREELYRRRPRHNPDLYCCDYDRYRQVVWSAIKGEGRWDAYELCDECLGGEYLPLAADLDG